MTTSFLRSAIQVFSIANKAYINATVAFYTVDDDGVRTETLATLYKAVTGSEVHPNPITLSSSGKFESAVYIDTNVQGVVSESSVGNHETGIIFNFAEASADYADTAKNWATYPVDDSVPGGGGEFSAKHYATKSSEYVDDAAAQAVIAEAAADSTSGDVVATAANVVLAQAARAGAEAARDVAVAAAGTFTAASAAEVNTGTDATKYLTSNALNDSNYGLVPLEFAYISGARPEVVDGAARLVVPSTMNGMDIVSVSAVFTGTVPSGAITTIQLHNETAAADILSTRLTVDSGERSSATAAIPAVINAAEDDLTTGDVIRLDIDIIGTTEAGTGLVVKALCRKP